MGPNISPVDSPPNRKGWAIADFASGRQFDQQLDIAPYAKENYGNIHWARLFYECDRRNIKVVAWGNSNHFPLMAMISHKVMHRPYSMSGMFSKISCYTTFSAKVLRSKFQLGIGRQYFATFNRQECPLFPLSVLKAIPVKTITGFYANRPYYLRQDSIDFFHRVISPLMERDLVICHIKAASFDQVIKHLLSFQNKYRLRGIDNAFNKALLEICQHHYMAVQILGSVLLGWRYIGISGAANLFCTIPVNALSLGEQYPYWLPESSLWKYQTNKKLYGYGTDCFSFPWQPPVGVRELAHHLPRLTAALESLPIQYMA